jgi:hypothetical protein
MSNIGEAYLKMVGGCTYAEKAEGYDLANKLAREAEAKGDEALAQRLREAAAILD